MEILQTSPEHTDFQQFLALPALLYPAESPRFRLPDSLPTEWLKACFVMQIDGQPQARAAIYENPAMRTPEGGKIFCLGAFESARIPATIEHFFPFLKQWAKEQGADYLVGQMNGSTWEQYRLTIGEDYTPFFLENYQHLYYNTLFEEAGFQVIERYFSSIDTELRHNAPAVLEQARKFEAMGVQIRPIDVARYEEELLRLHAFNQLAYQTNYLFSPISQEAFLRKYLPLRSLLCPDLVLLAEDKNKELIGMFFSIEDYWNRDAKTLVVKSVARHPAAQWRGLGQVIGNCLCQNAARLGYQQVIHAFLREQGTSTPISQSYTHQILRRYVLHGCRL